MSPGHVEVVRSWFDELARGNPAPEMCDAQIEIRNWAESPTPGPYLGRDGVERWWRDVTDAFDEVHFELQDVVEIDEHRVLTVQRIVGRFRLTEMPVDAAWGSVVEVRDGRIARATGYASPRRARRAAGLED